jgi:hypothetical protein
MFAASNGLSTAGEKKTPVEEAESVANLTQAYEVLRERSLSRRGETTPGLAILLQQGMVAWMEICSAVLPVAAPPTCTETDSLPSEVVTVMAQMVWACFEEVHA